MPIITKPVIITVYLPAGLEDISHDGWIAYKSDKGLVFDYMQSNADGARFAIIHEVGLPPIVIPPPPPKPIEYTTYHALQNMNLRLEPTTKSIIVGSADTNENLALSTEIVTTDFLIRLGKPTYTIEAGYEWRHVKDGGFIAAKIATKDTVALGAYVPPSNTSGKPSTLTGKNLHLVDTGDWVFLEGGIGLGANMRELAHWGDQNLVQGRYMSTGDYDRYFQFLKDNKFKWVRFYAFHHTVPVDTAIARVKVVCDKLPEYGLLACIVGMDSLADSGFTFKYYLEKRGELLPYHRESQGHLHKSFWEDEAWRLPYLSAMEKLVKALAGHTGVGMWQPFNEVGIYPQPSSTLDASNVENMFRVVTGMIHNNDPATPISGGFISTNQFAPTGADRRSYSENFWKNQPNIHVATIHAYQDMKNLGGLFASETYMHIDMEEAHKSGRATGITEFGSNSNRVSVERGFLERTLIARRGSFAMRWALENETVAKGIGDNKWGWMRVVFTDFDALLTLFKEYIARL